VYIVEQPSGSHVIAGVSTSVTAFVGAARMGPADTPTRVSSFADYVRIFGDPMGNDNPMGNMVQHFFANGGSQAIIVRALGQTADSAVVDLPAADAVHIQLRAKSRGAWANGVLAGGSPQSGLFVQVKPATQNPDDRFNLEIKQWAVGPGGTAGATTQETWTELSMSPDNPQYVETVLNASALATAHVLGTPGGPLNAGRSTGSVLFADETAVDLDLAGKALRVAVDQGDAVDYVLFQGEAPGTLHSIDDVIHYIGTAGWPFTGHYDSGTHLFSLQSATSNPDSAVVVTAFGTNDASAVFGLGVARGGQEVSGGQQLRPIPPPPDPLPFGGGSDGASVGAGQIVSPSDGEGMRALNKLDFPRFNLLCLAGVNVADESAISDALIYCQLQNAFLLVDPRRGMNDAQLKTAADLVRANGAHGAVYWPRLVTPDSGPDGFPPSGAVAGIAARTDAARGVWKAPAGLGAGVAGAIGVAYPTSDDVSGELNPLGINVLRSFPGAGLVVWGARTLAGSDVQSSDFKYVPVRRLTDYLSASLYLGTQFAVFEPNDPDLWAQLRLAVGGFMRGLFNQGAFQQSEKRAESDSFFVICDATVNPQTEIDAGRVNVVVGFAPLKPAEFVVITITQLSQAGA
jgi:phage tail sheath protein FI